MAISGHRRSQLRGAVRRSALTVALLAILPWPALGGQAPRDWRVIVLKGAQMRQLVGAAENRLEVLALHQGRLEPIPFQVDQVLPDGSYALPDGPEPVIGKIPAILDRNAEIAMMLSDLGERAERHDQLPLGTVEVSALDPTNGVHGYAYIAAVSSPSLSPVSYVNYEPRAGQIDGAGYRMTFRKDFPIGLALRNARGGWSHNLITGAQVRVTARVLMYFTLRFGASGVHNRVLAWRAGPIRLIRRVSHSVNLVLGITSPRVVSSEIFYRDYSQDSFVAKVLWVPRMVVSDVRVRTWLDFAGIDGFTLAWSGMDDPPLAIGSADAYKLAALRRDPPSADWIALTGDGKIVTQTFMPSPDLAAVRLQLYYCDGALLAEESDNCTGDTLQIGYLMTGWENLSAGTHRLESLLLVLPDDQNPRQVARELATPPTLAVGSAPG
ncbi:MAG: hypothetical protein ACREQR_09325 [Candidatus Binataceae bacterium]